MRIIIADTDVQQVPISWNSDKSVKEYMKKYGRRPLINGSIHQHHLQGISKEERRDRPDILHFGLLTLLGYMKILSDFEIFFSTQDSFYSVNPLVSIPRAQNRFYGILEQLLDGNDTPHIHKVNMNINNLAGQSIYFSSKGTIPYQTVDEKFDNYIFGGFASGTYRHPISEDALVANLSDKPLDLWTSLSLFLNQYMGKFTSSKGTVKHS